MRPCLTCGTPTANGAYCTDHDHDAERRNRKTVDHGVKRAHFQHLRRQRLDLADWRCELHVDEHCTDVATSVHLDPAKEGDHDTATIDDLRAGCTHCHGVVDGERSRGGAGRPIFEDAHSPGTGSKNERTGLDRAAKGRDGLVIA